MPDYRDLVDRLEEFLLDSVPEFFVLRTYNLIGMHHDADFMIWAVSDTSRRSFIIPVVMRTVTARPSPCG